jgi:4-hydroxy-4-methyl-2-oxoglutarate aldolase
MKINPSPAPLDSDLVSELREVDFPTFGHFLESGFLDPAIHSIAGTDRVVGRAVTVRTSPQDSTLIHHVTSLLEPGDVLVVDTGGDTRHAPVGGVIINALAHAGAAAVIIDGVCTDRPTLEASGVAVYARGTSVLTTKLLGLNAGGINIPISVGGVPVLPGWLVMADRNGVMIVDPADAHEVLDAVRDSDANEPGMLDKLRAGGVTLGELSGATELMARIG